VGVSRHLVAFALGTSLCGACASSTRESWRTELVKPGTPTATLGGKAPASSSPSVPREQQPLPALGASRPANVGLSVEDSDPQLSSALLREQAQPTAANHLRVAAEYRRLGILDFSARHVDAAIALSPRSAEAHEALAQIWRDWGFPDQGLGAAYRAVFYAPRSASAQNTLGTMFAALGRTDDARRAYERAVERDPGAGWALNNLCDLERRAGRLPVAVERCRSALGLDPDLKVAHNNLGLTYADLGDLSLARAEFMAAGDEAAANYNMGLVHMADGDYVLAANAFEAAIRLRPTFTAAKRRAHVLRLYLLTDGK
jgi:tetratricopeptide (TPR) repeat protein